MGFGGREMNATDNSQLTTDNSQLPRVWLNGALLPEAEARVSLFDRGYLYGDGLFETMRAYGGRIFRLRRHLERLAEGARAINLSYAPEQNEIEKIAEELLQANGLTDAYLRLTVSRGLGLGPLPGENLAPTVSLIARPLQLPSPETYERGWKAILVESALSPGSRLSQLKPLSYLDKTLAKMEAKKAGVDEAILVNSRGEITEASTSNLFLVKGNDLLTPPAEAGLLAGITRAAVLELAPALSLQVVETRLTPADLSSAAECFLTNSILEVMPLTGVGEAPIGEGQPGRISRKIHKAYQNLVKSELGLPG